MKPEKGLRFMLPFRGGFRVQGLGYRALLFRLVLKLSIWGYTSHLDN